MTEHCNVCEVAVKWFEEHNVPETVSPEERRQILMGMLDANGQAFACGESRLVCLPLHRIANGLDLKPKDK